METLETDEMTTAYTAVAFLFDTHLLVVNNCVPNGWAAIHADANETNSVCVVRVTVEAARFKERVLRIVGTSNSQTKRWPLLYH